MTCPLPWPERLNPPEESAECERCGSTEESRIVALTEEEAKNLNLDRGSRMNPVHSSPAACLCDECDQERRATWNDDSPLLLSVLQALGTAAGVHDTEVHPNLLAVKIAAKLPYHPTKNPGGVQ